MDYNDTDVEHLFHLCDQNASGYIELEDLTAVYLSMGLDESQANDVFLSLNSKHNGYISMEEFKNGFEKISNMLTDESQTANKPRKKLAECKSLSFYGFSESLRDDLDDIDELCDNVLYDLWYDVQKNEVLYNKFEKVIKAVLKQTRHLKFEIKLLENSVKRLNESHENQINQMQDEMELHICSAEQQAREKIERIKLTEKREAEKKLHEEIWRLKETVESYKLQEEENDSKNRNIADSTHLKDQIVELSNENNELKANVYAAQSNIASLRTEIREMQKLFIEQQRTMDEEKANVSSYKSEMSAMSQQLKAMHETNRRLKDNTDDLRCALDRNRLLLRSITPSTTSSTTSPQDPRNYHPSLQCSSDVYYPMMLMDKYGDPDMDEVDSGRYSQASSAYPDDDLLDSVQPEDSVSMISNRKLFLPRQLSVGEEIAAQCTNESPRATKSEIFANEKPRIERSHEEASTEISSNKDESPQPSADRSQSCDTLDSDKSFETVIETSIASECFKENLLSPDSGCPDDDSIVDHDNATCIQRVIKQSKPDAADDSKFNHNLIDPHNRFYTQERMYRVALAGDAAVGKSSFICRLCTGKFNNQITSTLGVDFHTKQIEIGDKLTNLQLWDTAGQERFRSIAKSYFRRADGVVLLYDSTDEQSFINVRDWINAIEEGTNRPIPIIICANKCDLEEEAMVKELPFVTAKSGERLADVYGAKFFSISAKDGTNVCEAILELSKMLWQAEDTERRTNGLTLNSLTAKETKFCCK